MTVHPTRAVNTGVAKAAGLAEAREGAGADAGATASTCATAADFGYRRHPDQDAATPRRKPVVVVGAGPVGLALAIDLALQQVPVVLLNDDGRLSVGSRALCFAKRTLDIFDRLGCGEPIVAQGVSWHVGRVFFRDEQVYQFDLLPEAGHRRPAFINLSQHDLEAHLVARAAQLPMLDLRWHHAVVGLTQGEGGENGHPGSPATLTVRTPEGEYVLEADHVIACDGSRSTLRRLLGLDTQGRRFKDRFLIADVRMRAPFPAERWFWFDPPFHPGQSVLLHRQPEGVWRIDFQLGWDADPEQEKRPENILPRVQALMAQASRAAGGDGAIPEMELVWASVYTFACLRMERFRHGRVIFAGDAAHGVSPFGARGANSGIQDAENLAWKLAWVVQGHAGEALLDTYAREREVAADDNIRHSTRSTDFITPKSAVSRLFRTAVLDLAKQHEFARKLVNSGRLSLPTTLTGSSLSTPDGDAFEGALALGAPMVDAPVASLAEVFEPSDGAGHNPDAVARAAASVSARASVGASADVGAGTWLLSHLRTGRFSVLLFLDAVPGAGPDEALPGAIGLHVHHRHLLDSIRLAFEGLPAPTILFITRTPPAMTLPGAIAGADDFAVRMLYDVEGLVHSRCDARPGTVLMLRPDQHLCARWRHLRPVEIRSAVLRATGALHAVAQPAPHSDQEPVCH
ncbi:FAD-dependent oxidoreductase [Roseateles terrae]|uniref:3-(3-hydroxy-phenyl)propionate hydroxylase n=1 Tax=Roseateles terrae TaxID=431060 RepID=A0ABR6GX38_9BURK|nr:FAD-dependent oxidoreductase [Roseateles terrae]MBB3196321.1 3-(3-hydroxy-phenyl)propionate hydroxylase [Roseateles terrae]OWQ83930.1 hypothetical protein CDN98_20810 [Roseateles terrae]